MNTPPNDSPELTAYALGELSAAQARDVHAMLASLPAALSELEQVEALTDALRQGAPIPQQRLTPEQRHAVLHPAAVPRLIVPMKPRQIQPRRPAVFWPALRGLTKAAALIAVAGLAFMLGRGIPASQTPVASTQTAPETPAPAPQPPVLEAPKLAAVETETTKPAAPVTAPAAPTVVVTAPAPVRPEVIVIPAPAAPAPIVATAPTKPAPKESLTANLANVPPRAAKPAQAPVQAQLASLGFTTPPASDSFVNASRKASDQFGLRPAQIRPLPTKENRAALFASPAPDKPIAADAKAPAKVRPADLHIHSWKADVTTCPWSETNRLLRIAIQLPADQPAALSLDNNYPLQVVFDPNNVREYRMLCERHQPAAELRSAGTHVIWYEYLPNGTVEPTRDNGKLIATVTLPGARFTTQAVEPFDGSKLRVQDRGQSWQTAREDFIFESSVVGFGMLLRGAPQTDRLNHQLVLNLANKSKGADPSGERTTFIRLVQEAKLAAGL